MNITLKFYYYYFLRMSSTALDVVTRGQVRGAGCKIFAS